MYLVEIVFGHSCIGGGPLPTHQIESMEHHALLTFSRFFKGGQAQRYMGSYLNDDGIAMIEYCTVIRAYTEAIEDCLPHLITLASEIAETLKQECVLLAVLHLDGTLHWVKPSPNLPYGWMGDMAQKIGVELSSGRATHHGTT